METRRLNQSRGLQSPTRRRGNRRAGHRFPRTTEERPPPRSRSALLPLASGRSTARSTRRGGPSPTPRAPHRETSWTDRVAKPLPLASGRSQYPTLPRCESRRSTSTQTCPTQASLGSQTENVALVPKGSSGPEFEFQDLACRVLIWTHPPDDLRVDGALFDRRQVLFAWHSKCDNTIAQGRIGNREFHTARIGGEAEVAARPCRQAVGRHTRTLAHPTAFTLDALSRRRRRGAEHDGPAGSRCLRRGLRSASRLALPGFDEEPRGVRDESTVPKDLLMEIHNRSRSSNAENPGTIQMTSRRK